MQFHYVNISSYKALSTYLTDFAHCHQGWAAKFVCCEAFNVVITVFTMLSINYFLGGEFFQYGFEVSVFKTNNFLLSSNTKKIR